MINKQADWVRDSHTLIFYSIPVSESGPGHWRLQTADSLLEAGIPSTDGTPECNRMEWNSIGYDGTMTVPKLTITCVDNDREAEERVVKIWQQYMNANPKLLVQEPRRMMAGGQGGGAFSSSGGLNPNIYNGFLAERLPGGKTGPRIDEIEFSKYHSGITYPTSRAEFYSLIQDHPELNIYKWESVNQTSGGLNPNIYNGFLADKSGTPVDDDEFVGQHKGIDYPATKREFKTLLASSPEFYNQYKWVNESANQGSGGYTGFLADKAGTRVDDLEFGEQNKGIYYPDTKREFNMLLTSFPEFTNQYKWVNRNNGYQGSGALNPADNGFLADKTGAEVEETDFWTQNKGLGYPVDKRAFKTLLNTSPELINQYKWVTPYQGSGGMPETEYNGFLADSTGAPVDKAAFNDEMGGLQYLQGGPKYPVRQRDYKNLVSKFPELGNRYKWVWTTNGPDFTCVRTEFKPDAVADCPARIADCTDDMDCETLCLGGKDGPQHEALAPFDGLCKLGFHLVGSGGVPALSSVCEEDEYQYNEANCLSHPLCEWIADSGCQEQVGQTFVNTEQLGLKVNIPREEIDIDEFRLVCAASFPPHLGVTPEHIIILSINGVPWDSTSASGSTQTPSLAPTVSDVTSGWGSGDEGPAADTKAPTPTPTVTLDWVTEQPTSFPTDQPTAFPTEVPGSNGLRRRLLQGTAQQPGGSAGDWTTILYEVVLPAIAAVVKSVEDIARTDEFVQKVQEKLTHTDFVQHNAVFNAAHPVIVEFVTQFFPPTPAPTRANPPPTVSPTIDLSVSVASPTPSPTQSKTSYGAIGGNGVKPGLNNNNNFNGIGGRETTQEEDDTAAQGGFPISVVVVVGVAIVSLCVVGAIFYFWRRHTASTERKSIVSEPEHGNVVIEPEHVLINQQRYSTPCAINNRFSKLPRGLTPVDDASSPSLREFGSEGQPVVITSPVTSGNEARISLQNLAPIKTGREGEESVQDTASTGSVRVTKSEQSVQEGVNEDDSISGLKKGERSETALTNEDDSISGRLKKGERSETAVTFEDAAQEGWRDQAKSRSKSSFTPDQYVDVYENSQDSAEGLIPRDRRLTSIDGHSVSGGSSPSTMSQEEDEMQLAVDTMRARIDSMNQARATQDAKSSGI